MSGSCRERSTGVLFGPAKMRTVEYSRPRNVPPETLIDYLCRCFSYASCEEWRENMARGYVYVDGVAVNDPSTPLKPRSRVGFNPPRDLEPPIDATFIKHHIDDSIVVVSKSGNLPVGEGGRYFCNTLTYIVAEELRCASSGSVDGVYAVHRLDKETSGLVVLARSQAAAANLGQQFAANSCAATGAVTDGAAKKRYQALLVGRLDLQTLSSCTDDDVTVLDGATRLRLTANIGHAFDGVVGPKPKPTRDDPLTKIRMKAFSSRSGIGKPAETHVRPIEYIADTTAGVVFTLCEIELFTGRTHQIRVHCAAVGFPVAGDKLYECGGHTCDVETYLRRARDGESVTYGPSGQLAVPRQLLHASMLVITHPTTMKRMEFCDDAFSSFTTACPWLADAQRTSLCNALL